MTAAMASVLKKDRVINLEAESTETLLTPSREHVGMKDTIHAELSEGLEGRMTTKNLTKEKVVPKVTDILGDESKPESLHSYMTFDSQASHLMPTQVYKRIRQRFEWQGTRLMYSDCSQESFQVDFAPGTRR